MEKVFDMHIHYSFEIPLPHTVEIFAKEFEETGTSKGCFLSLPYHDELGKIHYRSTQNINGLYLKRAFAPDFYAFAGLVYPLDCSDEKAAANVLLRQAEEYARVGYDGMKMLEGYPSLLKLRKIPLDSPIYDKYYAFMEENGLPIMSHIANPNENWDISKADKYAIQLGRVYDESYPSKQEITAQTFSVMKKFPKLKLILAHCGFFSQEKENAERFLGDYENTMLDITPGGEQLIHMSKEWAYWLNYFEKYQDRIIYGTDYYAFPDENETEWRTSFRRRPDFLRAFLETDDRAVYLDEPFTGVKLDSGLRKKLYGDNGMKLLGEPKKIDLAYMAKTAETLLQSATLTALEKADLQYILSTIEG